MKYKNIELNQANDHTIIETTQIRQTSNTLSPKKYENNRLSSQQKDNSFNNSQQNDSENQQRGTQESYSDYRKRTINGYNQNIKQSGMCCLKTVCNDKMKLKIVCIILVSLIFGIIFTGVMNYFLAILLSDHISETTTEEIGKVQIDFTRSMGLHYGNAYVNLIQQETDKSLKLYKKLKSTFQNMASTTPTPIKGDFEQIASNAIEYTDNLSKTPPNQSCPQIKPKDKILWVKNKLIQKIPDLDLFDQKVLKRLLSMFPIFRSISSDNDLRKMTITLVNDIEVSYPPPPMGIDEIKLYKHPNFIYTPTAKIPFPIDFESPYQKAKKQFDKDNRLLLSYEMKNITACDGKTYNIINVNQCISVTCGDFGFSQTSPICQAEGKDSKLCKLESSKLCGTVCTQYTKFTLSFLKSLEDKGIDRVYINQLDKNNSPEEIYKPFVFLYFQNMEIGQNFWQKQFNVSTYTGTKDSLDFYNKFDRYYTKYDSDYLATSNFSTDEDEFQISIFSIKQKLPDELEKDSGKYYMQFQYFLKLYDIQEVRVTYNFKVYNIKNFSDQHNSFNLILSPKT